MGWKGSEILMVKSENGKNIARYYVFWIFF